MIRRSIARFDDLEAARRRYDSLQPVGRLEKPEDIADGVLYLASDEARFVTGSELMIDGGYSAR
jgi:NAD(P)-dependent dehydrogenase (short-subunit alcohol dehydrogenase family)